MFSDQVSHSFDRGQLGNQREHGFCEWSATLSYYAELEPLLDTRAMMWEYSLLFEGKRIAQVTSM